MFPRHRPSARAWGAAVATSVVLVSALHYLTSGQSVVLHEFFRRLYYVPIVVAAVRFGLAGGVATAVFASALYLPHVWVGGPAPEQYGELLLFNVIGLVTGLLADRLRRERDRHERAAQQLARMVAEARERSEERLRLDRWATIGRLASGLAHEVRNPLGGLLGCLEILEQDFETTHPKREFFDIARQEVARLNALTASFLEFAHPAPPVPRRIDLREMAVRAAEKARAQGVRIKVRRQPSALPVYVDVDGDQVDRALVDIMRETTAGRADSRIVLAVEPAGSRAIARLEVSPFELAPTGRRDLFEPFSLYGCGNPLTLATARRLIENQGGVVQTEFSAGTMRCLVSFPLGNAKARWRPADVVPVPQDLVSACCVRLDRPTTGQGGG